MLHKLYLTASHFLGKPKDRTLMAKCRMEDLLPPGEDWEDNDDYPHLITLENEEFFPEDAGARFLVVLDGILAIDERGHFHRLDADQYPDHDHHGFDMWLEQVEGWVAPEIVLFRVERLPEGKEIVATELNDVQLERGNLCFYQEGSFCNLNYNDWIRSLQGTRWQVEHHYMAPPTYRRYIYPPFKG